MVGPPPLVLFRSLAADLLIIIGDILFFKY